MQETSYLPISETYIALAPQAANAIMAFAVENPEPRISFVLGDALDLHIHIPMDDKYVRLATDDWMPIHHC